MPGNDDQRSAASIATSLSTFIMTASLGVIAAWVAILTFQLDKREHLAWFVILSIIGLASTLASMVVGGRGIANVFKEGWNGTWDLNGGKKFFDWQAILALLGVILVAVSAACGTAKPERPAVSSPDPAVQRTIDDLRGQVADLKAKYSKLANRMGPPGHAKPGSRSRKHRH